MTSANDITHVTRRGVLGWLGAAPLLASCSREDPELTDLDAFMRVSASLTGFPVEELSREVGAKYLTSFMERGYADQLRALRGGDPTSLEDELKVEIIEAWFGGVRIVGEQREVVTFVNAKVWDAVDFAATPSVCKGAPGAWSSPGVRSSTDEATS